MWRHPKYYKELRKRNKSDQVISKQQATASGERSPGPGLKLQAATHDLAEATGLKQQAIDETVPHCDVEEASSDKPQASSAKLIEE